MKEEFTNRKSSILMPVLVGSAVGAGLALLLAPKPGKEIRKDLKRFATDTRDRISGAIDKSMEIYDEGRAVVSEAVETGRKTYVEGKEKFKEMTSKKERSLLVPILSSGIIGAGMALLLAPKSGREMRKDLKRIAAKTRDEVVVAIDKGKDLYEEGISAVSEAVEKGRKMYIAGKEKLRHAA